MASSSSGGREDLVGKRFLLVSSPTKLKLSRISDWPWKAGVIRCSSHVDPKDPELQILVELDYEEWDKREWINVYKDSVQLLAVENSLVLANRPHGPHVSMGNFHPALNFKPLIDAVGLWKGYKSGKQPVEFLLDLKLDFQDCSKLRKIKKWDPTIPGLNTHPDNEKCVNDWSVFQQCQNILLTTPSVLFGYRLKVYRAEGATQWYTAVTTGYNETTNEFTLTDDTVLEEHLEDPRLTQMELLGAGVVDAILRGDSDGKTPRRSRSSAAGNRASLPNTSSRVNSKGQTPQQKESVPKVKTNTSSNSTSSEGDKNKDDTSTTESSSSDEKQPESSPVTKVRGRTRLGSDNSRKTTRKLPEDSKSKSAGKSGKASLRKKLKKSSLPLVRKKTSKRVASLAASAALAASVSSSDNSKDEEEDDEHLKIPVRPKGTATNNNNNNNSQSNNSNNDNNSSFNNNNSPTAGSLPISSPKKNKAVAIVRPQPQQQKPEEEDREKDREARFSLYDFTSDSESEEKQQRPSTSAPSTPPKKLEGVSPKKKFAAGQNSLVSRKPLGGLGKKLAFVSSKKAASKAKKREESAVAGASSLASPPGSSAILAPPGSEAKASDDNNASDDKSKKMQELSQQREERSPDSGVSSSQRTGDDERSGSRSSALSDDQQTKHGLNNPPMGDRQHQAQQAQQQLHQQAQLAQLPASTSAAPPAAATAAAVAAAAMSAHHLNAIGVAHQYQAAAAMQASAGHAQQTAHILAQYHQMANSMHSNDIFLKQYPHLASHPQLLAAAAAAASGGARNPADLMLAREREMAMDRERQLRERREAEQRERERIEKERQEKERRERQERERRERERMERERLERERLERERREHRAAVEAVDHHFQLSMEVAKKRMAAHNNQVWGALPGAAKPPSSGHPAVSALSLEEERRRYETENARQYINAMAARAAIIGRPPAHSLAPPPAHGIQGLPVGPKSPQLGFGKPLNDLSRPLPGSPPPLAPLNPAAVASGQRPPAAPAVPFKPYDFTVPRRDPVPGYQTAYPTAYSAPPLAGQAALAHSPSQAYGKAEKPRPESLPAAKYCPAPPPAHSGLLKVHPAASGYPAASPAKPAVVESHDAAPLDLGAPSASKRKADGDHQHLASCSPTKSVKLDGHCDGLLFKVSEPSVLVNTAVPSTITAVENSAAAVMLKAEPRSDVDGDQEAKPVKAEEAAAAAVKSEEPAAAGSTEEFTGYVHKLKKAWIKSYSSGAEEDAKAAVVSSPQPSAPSTPLHRATPSPALSSTSSTTRGQRRSQQVNGHGSSSTSSKLEGDRDTSDDEDSEAATRQTRRGRPSEKKPGGGGPSKRARRPGKRGKRPAKADRGDQSTVDNSSVNNTDSDDRSEANSDTTTSSRRSRAARSKRGSSRSGSVRSSRREADSSEGGEVADPAGSANPFNNPPASVLKKTGVSFLQDEPCNKIAPKLAKCRECRWNKAVTGSPRSAHIFCRFYGFRRLRYHVKNGQMAVAGFCDPNSKDDVTKDDADVWQAAAENAPEGLDVDQAKYCLELLRHDYDLIVEQEKRVLRENVGEDTTVAWKRVVQGVSESCDVCGATLFNLHWACPRCGFVVCLDCYVSRKASRESADAGQAATGRDEDQKDAFAWLLCTNRSTHDLERLMLTQIITGNALDELTKKFDEAGIAFKTAKAKKARKAAGSNGGNESAKDGASLRDLIGGKATNGDKVTMSDIIDAYVEDSMMDAEDGGAAGNGKLQHFRRSADVSYTWRNGTGSRPHKYSLVATRSIHSKVAHSWLADNRVLRLEEGCTDSPAVLDLFRDVWARGQPVVVAKATKALNIGKWYPNGLNDEFGDVRAELVDVGTGEPLGKFPLRKFFDGYNSVARRSALSRDRAVVARVKGWPATYGEEFKEVLPKRSAEFIRMLPVPAYTGRAGPLNLAASLPDTFARAEVGPRALITYGDISPGAKPSVRLHVEAADSVVICVHAGVPKDEENEADFRSKAVNLMKDLGCDESAVAKARDERLPAAVWTVFHPADADKVRDMLNKSSGASRPPTYDPLLDDGVYVDKADLGRLEADYAVRPYVIAQFQGEAVFIPAGSPRQVRHLLSSTSLTSDFVSPENVSHTFFMYRQSRHLCELQSRPAEDKLSVKNLIFHSVKNALATLEQHKANGSSSGQESAKENEDEKANEKL